MKLLMMFSLLFTTMLFAMDYASEKEQLESRITERIQGRLAPFMKAEDYVVNVTVLLGEEIVEDDIVADESTENSAILSLSKLGIDVDQKTIMKQFFSEKKALSDMMESIEVNLMIPDTARAQLESDIRPIVEQLMSSYKPTPFQINLARFNSIKPAPEPTPAPPPEKTTLDYMETFQIPIAMVSVAILVFLLFILYIWKFSHLEGEKLEVMKTQSAAVTAAAGGGGEAVAAAGGGAGPTVAAGGGGGATVAAGGAATVAGGGAVVAGGGGAVVAGGSAGGAAVATAMPPAQMDRLLGFKQFEDLLENNTMKAAQIVKDWVNLGSYEALMALSVVPQHFGVEKMGPILNELDDDVRQQWRDRILDNLPENAYMMVNQYILSMTVENILVPPKPVEEELRGLLLNIRPEEAAQIAEAKPEYGAIFANLFEPIRVARMFSEMDPELVRRVSDASLSFNLSEAQDLKEDLRDAIEKVRGERETEKVAFLERSVDLIREVGPSKETEIYRALADAGKVETIREAAQLYTPASLIEGLSEELLKQRLSLLSLTERATLIASLEEDKQARFLACFGQEGKLRELIDVQLNELKSDETAMRKIERQKDKIWLDFVQSTRVLISENPSWRDKIEDEMDRWLEGFVGGPVDAA